MGGRRSYSRPDVLVWLTAHPGRAASPGAFGNVAIGLLLVTAATRVMEAGTRGSIIVASNLSREHVLTSLALNVAAGVALAVVIAVLAQPMVQRLRIAAAMPWCSRCSGLSVAIYAPAIVPLALLERRFQFKQRASVQAGATHHRVDRVGASPASWARACGRWSAPASVRGTARDPWLGGGAPDAAPRGMVAARERTWQRLSRHGAAGFMLFSLTDFVVFNADYLTVGSPHRRGPARSLFAGVLDGVCPGHAVLGTDRKRAVPGGCRPPTPRRSGGARSPGVRLTCLVLLPMLPVAIVLAPVVIPSVLGEKWQGMVLPFQILIVVGVAHAIVNVVGESLSGTGNIGLRARVNLVWMVGMIVALIALVEMYGMPGAALRAPLLYVPVAVAYGVWGMRLAEGRAAPAAARGAGRHRAGRAADGRHGGGWCGARRRRAARARVRLGRRLAGLSPRGVPTSRPPGRDALREARTFFTAGRRASPAPPSSARSQAPSRARSPGRC